MVGIFSVGIEFESVQIVVAGMLKVGAAHCGCIFTVFLFVIWYYNSPIINFVDNGMNSQCWCLRLFSLCSYHHCRLNYVR